MDGTVPKGWAPPRGSSLRRKAIKKIKRIPTSTGGAPCRSTNGAANRRSHCGERGQAASAPSRLPMTKDKMVVTNNNPIVQGSASPIMVETVLGYWLNDTPRSKRAILDI